MRCIDPKKQKPSLLDFLEGLYLIVMPTYLYGWKTGLLISSGLISIFQIAQVLLGRLKP